MRVIWLSASHRDVWRLHAFLKDVNPRAASTRVRAIQAAIKKLPETPRMGHVLDDYFPREVRVLFVSDCEVRYELRSDEIIILRLWHTREDR